MTTPRVDLEKLLGEIRNKLEESELARVAAGRAPLLHLSELEIRLKFVVSEKTNDKGGFDLKVVSLGESLTLSEKEVQEIVLRFQVPQEAVQKGVLGARHYGDQPTPPDVAELD